MLDSNTCLYYKLKFSVTFKKIATNLKLFLLTLFIIFCRQTDHLTAVVLPVMWLNEVSIYYEQNSFSSSTVKEGRTFTGSYFQSLFHVRIY